MMKEIVSHDAPCKIKHIQFGVLSQQNIVKMSELECVESHPYDITSAGKVVQRSGPLDPRLVGGPDSVRRCSFSALSLSIGTRLRITGSDVQVGRM